MSGDFRVWRVASFRCVTKFGRYRGIADIGEASTNQARPVNLHAGWPPRSSDAIFGLLINVSVGLRLPGLPTNTCAAHLADYTSAGSSIRRENIPLLF
jgi:hypothetical protein